MKVIFGVFDDKPISMTMNSTIDKESVQALRSLNDIERVRSYRYPEIRTVLLVMSSTAMVYDADALRQKIQMAYPDAAIFFQTTSGKPMGGMVSPHRVDLLIDLTGPGQRQSLFRARKLRKMAKHAVGRNVGLFRSRIYDRVFDEKRRKETLPHDILERERYVQRAVLTLSGVPFAPAAGVTQDLGKSIALNLPGMSHG